MTHSTRKRLAVIALIGVAVVLFFVFLAWSLQPLESIEIEGWKKDRETKEKKLTVVFSPGFAINLSGEMATIQGADECPNPYDGSAAMRVIFGSGAIPKDGCVVLSEDRDRAPVLIHRASETTQEEWEIIYEDDKFYVRRPSGLSVMPWMEEGI